MEANPACASFWPSKDDGPAVLLFQCMADWVQPFLPDAFLVVYFCFVLILTLSSLLYTVNMAG